VTASVVGLTVAVALLGLLVAGLLRAHAEVLRALHQLGVDLDPSRGAAESTPVLLRDSAASSAANGDVHSLGDAQFHRSGAGW
jgi:hypothetical protein